uniref:Uncharacterized protein n=1 Tax=Medicago truncatula TaxID=3880 RepID=I3STN4_MEDTR|nr:unknown [Medicago truncatula]
MRRATFFPTSKHQPYNGTVLTSGVKIKSNKKVKGFNVKRNNFSKRCCKVFMEQVI